MVLSKFKPKSFSFSQSAAKIAGASSTDHTDGFIGAMHLPDRMNGFFRDNKKRGGKIPPLFELILSLIYFISYEKFWQVMPCRQ